MTDLPPEGWQTRSLSSLGDYVNGYAFSKKHWSEHGLPIVRIAQITGTQDIVDRYQGQLPKAFLIGSGDLIFSWSGTLAVVKWEGGPAWLNQHLFKVVPTENVEQRFLFHVLRASVAEMDKRTHGSTMKHIKRSELNDFTVGFPECSEVQRKIAEILDTLDTVIHASEALIAKLKAVRQGLLHDLLTRGIDANGELRPPQPEAPHLYKPSPLGWIPRGWDEGPLQSWLCEKPKNGYSPQEAGQWTGIQMLGLGCLAGVGFEPSQLKNAPLNDARLDSAMLVTGDLLMSRANTRQLVGFVGVYNDVGTPCTYPDLMMRLKPSAETSSQFLQVVLRSPALRRQIQAKAVGTSESMVKISGRIVCDLVVTMPDQSEQTRILAALAADDAHLHAELKAVSALRDLKSGLMDDLLTGRVRVAPLLDAATA